MGLFRTFIAMRMKGVRSLREMTRQLDTDLKAQKAMPHQTSRERLHKKRPEQVYPQSRRKPPYQNNRRESYQAPETERRSIR